MDPLLDILESATEITKNVLITLEGIWTLRRDADADTVVSPRMKRAYCSVAVDLTVAPLLPLANIRTFKRAKRMWEGEGRVAKVLKEGTGPTSLGSDQLQAWSILITGRYVDGGRLVEMFRNSVKALNDVKAFVKEEGRDIELNDYGEEEENGQTRKRRRKTERWDAAEEAALLEGVAKYGKGDWSLILEKKKEVFLRDDTTYRVGMDLKDKWRVLTRPDKN